jgi:uncharacterized protein with ACT and thioredoxin-like domain
MLRRTWCEKERLVRVFEGVGALRAVRVRREMRKKRVWCRECIVIAFGAVAVQWTTGSIGYNDRDLVSCRYIELAGSKACIQAVLMIVFGSKLRTVY